MKNLTGTIRTENHTEVQRLEGNQQAPKFVIYDRVYHTYSMNESYVTTGVEDEHHVLDALVASEFRYSDETLQWFNLHVDYHANTWNLTKTTDPKED